MSTDLPADLIKISRAAKLADVSPSTIWRWILDRKLRSWKWGGHRRVSEAELYALARPVEEPLPHPPARKSRAAEELKAAGWL